MNTTHIGEICTECGTAVAEIMWGMPTEEGAAEARANGWYLGGCCIDESVSRCGCGSVTYDRDGQLLHGRAER